MVAVQRDTVFFKRKKRQTNGFFKGNVRRDATAPGHSPGKRQRTNFRKGISRKANRKSLCIGKPNAGHKKQKNKQETLVRHGIMLLAVGC